MQGVLFTSGSVHSAYSAMGKARVDNKQLGRIALPVPLGHDQVQFRGVSGAQSAFAARVHSEFPHVTLLEPVQTPDIYSATKEVAIGEVTILNRKRKPVKATVSSDWSYLDTRGNALEKIYIKAKAGKGKPEQIVGAMNLVVPLERVKNPQQSNASLKIATLYTDHTDFHGVGTALAHIAMQRHQLLGGTAPITVVTSNQHESRIVKASESQFKVDKGLSSVPFYRMKGFRLVDDCQIEDPENAGQKVSLANFLDAHQGAWEEAVLKAIPGSMHMTLSDEAIQAQSSTVWQEPVNFVELPKRWLI